MDEPKRIVAFEAWIRHEHDGRNTDGWYKKNEVFVAALTQGQHPETGLDRYRFYTRLVSTNSEVGFALQKYIIEVANLSDDDTGSGLNVRLGSHMRTDVGPRIGHGLLWASGYGSDPLLERAYAEMSYEGSAFKYFERSIKSVVGGNQQWMPCYNGPLTRMGTRYPAVVNRTKSSLEAEMTKALTGDKPRYSQSDSSFAERRRRKRLARSLGDGSGIVDPYVLVDIRGESKQSARAGARLFGLPVRGFDQADLESEYSGVMRKGHTGRIVANDGKTITILVDNIKAVGEGLHWRLDLNEHVNLGISTPRGDEK